MSCNEIDVGNLLKQLPLSKAGISLEKSADVLRLLLTALCDRGFVPYTDYAESHWG